MSQANTQQPALRVSVAPSASHKDVFIVRVDGSVDTLTADDLDNVISTLVRQNRNRLVIDLAGAQYVSSAGWGIFISRLRETREGGGDLKLARMTPPVHDVYDLLELDGVLGHFDRLDHAESNFNGGNGQTVTTTKSPQQPPGIGRAPAEAHTAMPSSLEDAIRQLVIEDPFYTSGEFRSRLGEVGFAGIGRFKVLRTLWSMGLMFRHQRFRYYRKNMHGPRTTR